MTETASFERHGEVGVVHMRAPAGTGLTAALRRSTGAALRQAEADGRVRTIVLLAEGGALAAEPGFGPRDTSAEAPEDTPEVRTLADRLEGCAKPVVGALDGAALDEGLEVLLACPVRLATRRSRLGFPSAALGVVPGAGGTQRLPRLVGIGAALDLFTSGEIIGAEAAATLGLIDGVEKEPLVGSAVAAARRLVEDRPAPKVCDRPTGGDADMVRRDTERLVEMGVPVRLTERLGEAVEAAVTRPFTEGLAREAKLAAASRDDVTVKALLHLTRARIVCREAPEFAAAEAWPLGSVAVVGAGVMGSAIAILCTEHNVPVMLVDRDPLALSRGLGVAQDHFTRRVEDDGLDEAEAEHRMALIQHSTKLREVAQASLTIEAVTEDPAVKESVFRELSDRCRPRAVLATNTASLDVDRLAGATECPAQVLAMHVLSPALERRVIEIAAGSRTAPEAAHTAAAFAARIGRIPVPVGNRRGFIGTRLLEAYAREAWRIIEDGGRPEEVDAAMSALGFLSGPFVLTDRIGVDGAWRLRDHPEGSQADRLPPASTLPEKLAAAGRAGIGQLQGWYQWTPVGGDDLLPEADDAWRAHLDEPAGSVSGEAAAERLLLTLVNQAAVLLEQGAAFRPGDVDVVAVDAVGFPETLGGPLFHADATGLPQVVERLKALEADHGAHFHPAGVLVRRADTHRAFAEWKPGD